MAGAVVLFDGVCNLCAWSVRFIIARDPQAYFQFASLQSDVAQNLLRQHGVTQALNGTDDSVILIEDGVVYTHSTASLRVARRLTGVVRWAYPLIIVPAFIRNTVYRWIARNRYRWFGKQDECWLPTPALKARFLD